MNIFDYTLNKSILLFPRLKNLTLLNLELVGNLEEWQYNKMKMIKTEYNNRDLIKRVKIYLNFFIKSNFNYILLLLLYFLGEYV